MAKRQIPQPNWNLFGGRKRPKLNMSITKGRPPPKTDQTLWDDDDDDVILLATQIESQALVSKGVDANNTEITFSEFMPDRNTSTQRNDQATPSKESAANDILMEMFADDDDDLVMMSAVEIVNTQNNPKANESNNDIPYCLEPQVADFKEPQKKTPIQNLLVNGGPITRSAEVSKLKTSTTAPSQQNVARKQLADERQIKFLMDRVDMLKKMNSKLSTELTETKGIIESKDGEATLLRNEVRYIKNQMQMIRMEKMVKSDADNNKSQHKLEAMKRQIEAKETELQLKVVECSMLRMRHADDAKRPGSSSLNDTLISRIQNGRCTKVAERAIMRISALNTTSIVKASSALPILSNGSGNTRSDPRSRKLFEKHFRELREVQAQLQSTRVHSIVKQGAIIEQIVRSAKVVFDEFHKHILTFSCSINRGDYPDYETSSSYCSTDLHMLINSDRLCIPECCGSLRRYAATLSVTCQLLPSLPQKLLLSDNLIKTISSAIWKLGLSSVVHQHNGVLEAFAHLLLSLLRSLQSEVEEQHVHSLVVEMLKQLVFVRPSVSILRTLTDCVLQCVQLPGALALLCTKSDNKHFVTNYIESQYSFTQDSCIIQVYAALLEIAIPFDDKITSDEFLLFCAICENHVRFVFQCFTKPPQFIHDCLPIYETDEHVTSDNAAEEIRDIPAKKCECYTKLCLSVVTLLFQLLHAWISNQNTFKNHSRISTISKIAVQLLHVIFCDYYMTCLFRDTEDITRHYLGLICKWWQENVTLLKFHSIHLNFLRKLQTSHNVTKRMNDETTQANIIADLKEWNSLTKDHVPDAVAESSDGESALLESLKNMNMCFDN